MMNEVNDGKKNVIWKVVIGALVALLCFCGVMAVRADDDNTFGIISSDDESSEGTLEDAVTDDTALTLVEKVSKYDGKSYQYNLSADGITLLTLDGSGIYDDITGLITYSSTDEEGNTLSVVKTPDGGVVSTDESGTCLVTYEDGTVQSARYDEDGSLIKVSLVDELMEGDTEENSGENTEGEDTDYSDAEGIYAVDTDEEDFNIIDEDGTLEVTDGDGNTITYDQVEYLEEVTGFVSWDETDYEISDGVLNVELGTDADDVIMQLPDMILVSEGTAVSNYYYEGALVYTESEPVDECDEAPLALDVTWSCTDYNGDEEGIYVFSPSVEQSFSVYKSVITDEAAASLPDVTVQVGNGDGLMLGALLEDDEDELTGTSWNDEYMVTISVNGVVVQSYSTNQGTYNIDVYGGDNIEISLTRNYANGDALIKECKLSGVQVNAKTSKETTLDTDEAITTTISETAATMTFKPEYGSKNGNKYVITVTPYTQSGSELRDMNPAIFTINVLTEISINASTGISGNVLRVYSGTTVELQAVHPEITSLSGFKWISNINSVNGNYNDGAQYDKVTYVSDKTDNGKWIEVEYTDPDTGEVITSSKLNVVIIDASTDSPEVTANPESLEFKVTEGYKNEVSKSVSFNFKNTDDTFKMKLVTSGLSELKLGDLNRGSGDDAKLDVTLLTKSSTTGEAISKGTYNENIEIKYGVESSLDYAYQTLTIPVHISVLEPTRIYAQDEDIISSGSQQIGDETAAYAGSHVITNGDSVTLAPRIVASELGDTVSYQWYQIPNFDAATYLSGSVTYSESDVSKWTAISGATGKTYVASPAGSESANSIYAYMLVATDTCGTVSISDKPMVVTVKKMVAALTVTRDDSDSTAYPNIFTFDDKVAGYSSETLTSKYFTISNTGNQKITNIKITGISSFDVLGIKSGSSLAPGDKLTIEIRPKTGLSAGTYNEEFQITSDTVKGTLISGTNSYTTFRAKVTVDVRKEALQIAAYSDKKFGESVDADFGAKTEGYSEAPDYTTVAIKNTGNATLTIDAPSSSNYEFKYFDRSANTSTSLKYTTFNKPVSLDPSDDDSDSELLLVQIVPKTGLKANGTDAKSYKETIKFVIDGQSTYVSANVSFTVNPKLIASITKAKSGDKTTLTASVTGGTSPYTYKWSENAGSSTDSSVSVTTNSDATYTVTVTDASGTTATAKANTSKAVLTVAKKSGTDAEITFDSVIEGYSVAPDAVTLVLTNNGSCALSGVTAEQPENFTITGLDAASSLAKGKSAEITVRPKIKLTAGTYSEKLKFTSDQVDGSQIITLNFTVTAAKETLKVEPETLTFAETSEGYTKVADAQSVKVTNSGNTTVTVKVPTPANFKIGGFSSDKKLAAGESFSFTVQPATGMAAGTHSELIALKTGSGEAVVTAQIKVNKKPSVKITGSGTADSGVASEYTAEGSDGTAPYTYKWSTGGTGQTENVTVEKATTLTVTLTDAAGVTAKASTTVSVAGKLSVAITGNTTIRSGGIAKLTAAATGGTSPYTYTWSSGETAASISVSPETTTSYKVTAKDKLGATATAEVTVKLSELASKTTEDKKHILTADTTQLDFGTVQQGYNVSLLEKKVTLTNNGTSSEVVQVPTSDYFVVSGMANDTKLEVGESVIATIIPKTNLKTGYYTEVIRFETNSRTSANVSASFKVTDADGTIPLEKDKTYVDQDYSYGTGKLGYNVVSDNENSPIGIADTSSAASAVLTEEEMQMVADGADVNIRVTSKTIDDSISASDKELIENALNTYKIENPDLTVGMYVDITLEKQIDGGDWVTVTETAKPVDMVYKVPDSIKSLGSKYYMYRVHDGVVNAVAEWEGGEEEVEFTSTKYSTYAICYVPKGAEDNLEIYGMDGASSASGSSTPTWIILVMVGLGVVLAGLIALLVVMKRREE